MEFLEEDPLTEHGAVFLDSLQIFTHYPDSRNKIKKTQINFYSSQIKREGHEWQYFFPVKFSFVFLLSDY